MSVISEMLSHPFLMRTPAGGMLVSLCASLLGVNLMLKRYSMTGDRLSHVFFGALSIVLAMGRSLLKVSIPVVVLAAFFLLRITEGSRIKSNTAAALVSANVLTIGVIIISFTTGLTTGMSSYMFGSILAMSREGVVFSAVLPLVVLILFAACYGKIFAVTFDESFARATGINVNFYSVVIAAFTAVTIVLEMRTMGVTLIPSLIILPCLPSVRVFKNFGGVMVLSDVLPVLYFLIGTTTSCQLSTPAGASVVVADLLMSMLFTVWQSLNRLRT